MSPFSSYHTHSRFCDGKNTPEEMVQEAIRLGCPAIGFTGHSNTPFDPGYCMDDAREKAYRQEVRRLQQVCGSQIRILLGIEQDFYSAPAHQDYQYRIGSVHYVEKDGCYISVDDTPEILRQGVLRYYGGDFYSLAEDYFRIVSQVPEKTGCQILGHFDLICKFNRDGAFFDPDHPRYQAAALAALDSLLDRDVLLEINTGAMSRGYRNTPYPSPFLLAHMGRRKARAIVTSDAHRARDLLFGLPEAAALAESFGIRLTEDFL